MNRRSLLAAGGMAVIAAVMLLDTPQMIAVSAADLGAARVNHIGIVVADVDGAVQQYVRVMGFAPAKPSAFPVPMPNGLKAEIKFATLFMPNFQIELVQPLNNQGPYFEHLQKHGMSIQHMGLAISDAMRVDELRTGLEQAGGHWTLGSKGGAFAYVGFEQTLGTTFELNQERTGPTTPVPSGDALPPLASLPVSHVGFAAVSTAAAVETFTKVLGIAAPTIRDYKDSQYPPEMKWNPAAPLRLTLWNQGGVGIEIIESVGGPTPWSDYVQRQKGTAPQHLAINVGNRMDETIRDLVAKGGKWTNGRPGGNYAYVDFMDTLGLIFELNGTSKTTAGQ